jgi:molecular chaperone GrpE (heat shock protein)
VAFDGSLGRQAPRKGAGERVADTSEQEHVGVAGQELTPTSTPTLDGTSSTASEAALLKGSMQELLDLFNARLRYDARKDELIQRLTDQVNALSEETRDATKAPILHDVILLRDSIAALRKGLARKESWETPQLLSQLDVVLAEVTEVLERQDVLEWVPTGERQADRKWQRPVSTVSSDDPLTDGAVVEVVRPGYVRNGNVFRPQDVVVTRARALSSQGGNR